MEMESDRGGVCGGGCCAPSVTPSVLHASGKNVRRSIQGVGHMMSTMVLNRKQSVFGTPSLPAGAEAAEPLDRSKFEENEDIVVMETKLKILEILQVPGGQEHSGRCWEWAGRWAGLGSGWVIPLRSVSHERCYAPRILTVQSWDQQY